MKDGVLRRKVTLYVVPSGSSLGKRGSKTTGVNGFLIQNTQFPQILSYAVVSHLTSTPRYAAAEGDLRAGEWIVVEGERQPDPVEHPRRVE